MVSTTTSEQPSGVARSRLSEKLHQGFSAPFRLQTYKNLLYLALAFPLGLVYFVGFIFGVALGFGLLITWIGLPILLLTLLATTAVAGFEANFARSLCGVNASNPTILANFDFSDGLVFPGEGFVDAVRRLVTARDTWVSVVLVLTKFGFGVFSFVALTVGSAVTGAFLAAPFIYDDPDVILGVGEMIVDAEYVVGPWLVDTFPEAVVAAVVGIVFLFVALNLLNSLAQFQAQYTANLIQEKN